MEKDKKIFTGWLLIIASIVLCFVFLFQVDAEASARTVKLVVTAACFIAGLIILKTAADGKEYWRNQKPRKQKKVIARVSKETDYETVSRIAVSAPSKEVCAAAGERKYRILLESLERDTRQEDLNKTLSFILRDRAKDDRIAALLKTAAEKHRDVTRQFLRTEVGRTVAQNGIGRQIDFLVEVAKLYPDIIRQNYAGLRSGLHTDSNRHEDKAPGFHTDSTQYYDYFRYPDGRTVANRNGRQRHTDTRSSYSDCHNDAHADTTTHTDSANLNTLEALKPYISEEP